MNGWDAFVNYTHVVVDEGKRVKFWDHVWCGEVNLRVAFPSIYQLACARDATVLDHLLLHDGATIWDIRLRRQVRDREEALMALLSREYGMQGIGEGEDEMR
ncbi:hypothetical protein RHMOL_Rhmol07G0182300 [Rhododendron molle]|uniref:Uncharacterized protein n=1 Tax=Rhododendron molle TaxID=49168 RepID=A0ACC0N2P8_RHOML|nr:hypothetical protein RHMOL_Rhmol07G0182300 [Rhododendron molle]